MSICDWLWISTVGCDECVQWNWIFRIFSIGCEYLRLIVNIFTWLWCVCVVELNFRIIPIGCEYLRLIVNICSWLWCMCTSDLNFTNILDWLWIFSIDCEYAELNVMYVYSVTDVYEYFRINVNICDRLWIFLV